MDEKKRILVADDDDGLRAMLSDAIRQSGFAPICAADGRCALSLALGEPRAGLCIMDIGMPLLDGMEALRQLRRKAPEIPVIMLTSRDEEIDKVLALELGADDYITKPFSTRELIARIKAVLRRISPEAANESSTMDWLEINPGLRLCESNYRVLCNGSELCLTVTEFRLLLAFCQEPMRVFDREGLMLRAYPDERFLADRSIDSHIKRLRRKLTEAGAPEDLIETVYGIGYRLRPGR